MSNSKLIYRIREVDATERVTCIFHTEDPFIALADILLKAKNPLGDHFTNKSSKINIRINIWNHFIPVYHPEFIEIEMWITDKISKETILKVRLSTFIANKNYKAILDPKSELIYHGIGYESALLIIRDKIKKWFGNDVELAKILTICAARDQYHSFWKKKKDPNKKKDLDM